MNRILYPELTKDTPVIISNRSKYIGQKGTIIVCGGLYFTVRLESGVFVKFKGHQLIKRHETI